MSVLYEKWMEKAEEDFAAARYILNDDVPFHSLTAFLRQQFVEKFLKALLVHDQVPFPKTHDIESLLDIVETSRRELADSLRPCAELSPYAVETRYPLDAPHVTEMDCKRAMELAERARQAIRKILPVHINEI